MDVTSASAAASRELAAAQRETARVERAERAADTARLRFEDRVEEAKTAAKAPAYGGSIDIIQGSLVDIRV